MLSDLDTHSLFLAKGLINADDLNTYYASISTDNSYQPPTLKAMVNPKSLIVPETQVFHLLDHLQPTAEGADQLPTWFLRLLVPVISGWLAQLINRSLCESLVPSQWKLAIIKPAPKVKSPQQVSDYHPISVLPILSRIVERIMVHNYL